MEAMDVAVPGELLMCHHRDDSVAARLIEKIVAHKIEQVGLLTTLEDHLFRLGLRPRPGMQLALTRLSVPEGEEVFKINHLHLAYNRELRRALHAGKLAPTPYGLSASASRDPFQVVPHLKLSLTTPRPAPGDFQLGAIHDVYKSLLNVGSLAGGGAGRAILLLDSGVASTRDLRLATQRDFVNPSRSNADDDHGHGTAVASIIRDLCPEAQLSVFKVVDKHGGANEWNILAALSAQHTAHVVNMSVTFRTGAAPHGAQGQPGSNRRCPLFEEVLSRLLVARDAPVVVAPVGDDTARDLNYPARHAEIVAVTAINSRRRLSSYANRGTQSAAGMPHPNVYAAPGGDEAAPVEDVGRPHRVGRAGTSYAAAYATGTIVKLWSTPPYDGLDRLALLAELRARADRRFEGYDPELFGNGLLRA